jgi:hypothetical protein
MSSEKSFQALRAIWDKVAVQAPDGKKYLVFKSRTDLDYLYCTGFVDETKYKPSDWVDAFSDSLMPNGAYMVSEGQWLDKVKHHFWGPVGLPWNPLELREGVWEEKEFRAMIDEKIMPQIFFTAEEFEKVLSEAKKNGLTVNGKYMVTKVVKQNLIDLLNDYPSPRRAREMDVAALKGQLATGGTAAGQTQKSGFAKGTSPSQQAADRLSQILSKR